MHPVTATWATPEVSSPFLERPTAEHVARNELAFAIRDRYPVSPGHTLVVPFREVPTWFDATLEEQRAILDLVDDVRRDLMAGPNPPHGFNVGFNAGEAGKRGSCALSAVLDAYALNDAGPPTAAANLVHVRAGTDLLSFDITADTLVLVGQSPLPSGARAVVAGSDGRPVVLSVGEVALWGDPAPGGGALVEIAAQPLEVAGRLLRVDSDRAYALTTISAEQFKIEASGLQPDGGHDLFVDRAGQAPTGGYLVRESAGFVEWVRPQ